MRLALLVLVTLCACRRQPSPPVTPREPARAPKPVAPALTPQLALETIEKRYVAGMQRCYRAKLKRDPRARGKVVVTFTVDDRGQVADRRAKGVHESIERCVESAMMKWTFPRPAAETTFRLAFRLTRT